MTHPVVTGHSPRVTLMPARILIIEDNPANLELMIYLLTAFGHVPLSAQSGEQGLTMAHREKPDLIVCDIQLPGMDGYSFTRQLKTSTALRAVPLVAVTALAMVGDRDKVLAAGFDGYISKPIEPESFVTRVEEFLRPDQRSANSPARRSAPPPVAVGRPATGAMILVVDDQPLNLNLKRSILEPTGYSVVTADTMAEALELARRITPDLIISDVQMADGDGFQFIRTIRADEQLRHVPVVFITSTCQDEASRRKGLALGAARFLFRPLDPQVLLAEVEACLRVPKAS